MTVDIKKHRLFYFGLILMVTLACVSPVSKQHLTDQPFLDEDADATMALTDTNFVETAPLSVSFDESRVRGILFDIQQYPMEDYYRQSLSSDINAVEALLRWDSGVRVTNADEFEKIIIEGNMEIVRKTEPNLPIDNMDIKLTTD